jgi:hypothetical protein
LSTAVLANTFALGGSFSGDRSCEIHLLDGPAHVYTEDPELLFHFFDDDPSKVIELASHLSKDIKPTSADSGEAVALEGGSTLRLATRGEHLGVQFVELAFKFGCHLGQGVTPLRPASASVSVIAFLR